MPRGVLGVVVENREPTTVVDYVDLIAGPDAGVVGS